MSSGYYDHANQAFDGLPSHPPPVNDSQSSHMDQIDIKQLYDAYTNDHAHTSEHFDPQLGNYNLGYPQDQATSVYTHQGQPSHIQGQPVHYQIPSHTSGHPIDLANNHLEGGLHIQPDGIAQYGPTDILESNTVATLEAAAARSAAQYTQPSISGGHSASSRRSTLDSVSAIASLSLSSPRHSLSTNSSSSSQNSPTTPLSANSMDSGSYAQIQQQQYRQMCHNQLSSGYPTGYGPAVHPAYIHAQFPQPGSSAMLSMSMPPSMAEASQSRMYGAGYQHPRTHHLPQNVHKGPSSLPLSQSAGKLSSAGLLDQVVSARRSVVSPDIPEVKQTVVSSKSERRQRRDSRSSRSSRSRTSTPPSTPARAATLRSSRATSNASQAGDDQHGSQTPSSAGPHRTPSKRIQAALEAGQSASSQGTAPQRPGGLRRSTSEYGSVTPKTAKKYSGSAASSGLGSPADMSSIIMRQQQSEAYSASIAALQQSANDTSGSGMMRTRSSPGFASSLSRPSSSSSSTSTVPRRSSTLSGLAMSPMPRSTALQPPGQGDEVSYENAVSALDQIALFLNEHSVMLAKAPNQDVRLALGTFEQLQSVEDIRARIQARLRSSAFIGT